MAQNRDWWMMFRGTIKVTGPFGGGVAWFLLGDQHANYSWPVTFYFGALGGNFQAVKSYSDPSKFKTSAGLDRDDFSGWGSMSATGAGLGSGGLLVRVNFDSISHHPTPIQMQGMSAGLGVGTDWSKGWFNVHEEVVPNKDVFASALYDGSDLFDATVLDDDDDLYDAVADLASDYLLNNTDPLWINA
jgi:hypothetical protein